MAESSGRPVRPRPMVVPVHWFPWQTQFCRPKVVLVGCKLGLARPGPGWCGVALAGPRTHRRTAVEWRSALLPISAMPQLHGIRWRASACPLRGAAAVRAPCGLEPRPAAIGNHSAQLEERFCRGWGLRYELPLRYDSGLWHLQCVPKLYCAGAELERCTCAVQLGRFSRCSRAGRLCVISPPLLLQPVRLRVAPCLAGCSARALDRRRAATLALRPVRTATPAMSTCPP